MLTFMERTHLSRWVLTDPSFAPQADSSLFIPGFGWRQMCRVFIPNFGCTITGNICVVEEDSRIILANENRELYELDLKTLTFKQDTFSPSRSRKSSHEHYCQRKSQLSTNGHRLVVSYITCPQTFDFTRPRVWDEELETRNSNKTHIELRFFETSRTAEEVQIIELEYLEAELPANHWHIVQLSPDLSMVRAGCSIFDLQASGYPLMSAPKSLLSHLACSGGSSVSFSSCSNYLTAFQPTHTAVAGVEYVRFGLFRICHTTRNIEESATDGLEDLVGSINWASFHPVLPVLLLTCFARRASGTKTNLKATKVVEIDLREHELVPIVLLHKLVMMGFKSY